MIEKLYHMSDISGTRFLVAHKADYRLTSCPTQHQKVTENEFLFITHRSETAAQHQKIAVEPFVSKRPVYLCIDNLIRRLET